MIDIAIIGGGAAGYYAAIQSALLHPHLSIAIFERGVLGLEKVKVSGGGRCNVTHNALVPEYLATHYPRGEKALLGPFYHHGPKEVIAFFKAQGVPLKVEPDGRMFPVANTSQAVIDCFVKLRESLGITLYAKTALKSLSSKAPFEWVLGSAAQSFKARTVLMATGSNPKILHLLDQLGHNIEKPVPSLFTFNIKDSRIAGLAGVSTPARVKLILAGVKEKKSLKAAGPLLITHWGMSGPAVLKISAWGARALAAVNYEFKIAVNFLPELTQDMVLEQLQKFKKIQPNKFICNWPAFKLPKRLWVSLVVFAGIPNTLVWAHLTKTQLLALSQALAESVFSVKGKSTFKEEFVTAGGVKLKEVSFKDLQSKKFPGLFFAGEILNIDAITGGFNFQNAWTTAYLAAQGMVAVCTQGQHK